MTYQFRCDNKTALVQTDKGTVKGYAFDGLLIFKGIPYAKARRFHAPQPAEPWEGVLDAASYGYVCPLLANDRPSGELYVPHRYWPMDEDCQNLNIWTPGADSAKRPVLVWLHGGGYEAGSAIEQTAYDGANMSLLGDVVVVSVNHRLNILGYFDLSDYGEEYANSGNAGTDDIVAALRWVRNNIEAFGGDPDNVTVFGQSGGGAKVTTLLQTPAADGLYAKGINMSGVIGPVLADAVGSGRDLAEALMAELGIGKSGIEGVRMLETMDYTLLAKTYRKVKPALVEAGKYAGCCPHPNAYYAGEPTANGFRPETKDVPLLVGSVFGEFLAFSPLPCHRESMSTIEQEKEIRSVLGDAAADELLPLFRTAYPEREPIDLLRLDFIFRAPEIDYIAKRSRLNNATYSYLFNMDQPINGGNPPWHCCDVPYVFHNIDLVEYPHGPQTGEAAAEQIEAAVFACVMAFVQTGNPKNPLVPDWPACKAGEETTMVIGGRTGIRTNFDHTLIAAQAKHMGPVFAKMMAQMDGSIQH